MAMADRVEWTRQDMVTEDVKQILYGEIEECLERV